MKKLILITGLLLGGATVYAEEGQNDNPTDPTAAQANSNTNETKDQNSKTNKKEKDDSSANSVVCEDDDILDSLDKALKSSGYSLESEISTRELFSKNKKFHAGTSLPNSFGSDSSSSGGIMVEVPLTPKIILEFMDKAIKEARNCRTSWYKKITDGTLKIDDESKAGAAAFIAEALKNKMPRKQVESYLLEYFRGTIKWETLMSEAKNKTRIYSSRPMISPSFPLSEKKKLKTPLGEAR